MTRQTKEALEQYFRLHPENRALYKPCQCGSELARILRLANIPCGGGGYELAGINRWLDYRRWYFSECDADISERLAELEQLYQRWKAKRPTIPDRYWAHWEDYQNTMQAKMQIVALMSRLSKRGAL